MRRVAWTWLTTFAFANALALGLAAAASPQEQALAGADALRAGDPGHAVMLLEDALTSPDLAQIDRARALMARGLAYQQLGRRDAAVADYGNAIWLKVLPPEDLARTLFNRGVALDEMGRTDSAINDYSAALDMVPRFSAALNNRANAYRRAERFAEAKRDYQASLDAGNPEREYPCYGLGQIAEAEGDMPAARAYYQDALNANAAFALARERLAALKDGSSVPIARAPQEDMTPASFVRLPGDLSAGTEATPTALPSFAPRPRTDGAPVLRAKIVEPARTPSRRATAATRIQVGAYRAETEAAEAWNRIVGEAGDLLLDVKPQIEMADIPGKGIYYRLRSGRLPHRWEAETLCHALKSRGVDCIAVGG